MRKLVRFESLHVEQEGAAVGSSVFGIGKGEPFPVGGPTDGRGNRVRYMGGEEFAFRSAQCGHNVDASVVSSQTMKSNLRAVGGPRRTDPFGRMVG